MEGNFLSRYNKRMDEWMEKIESDPKNKSEYESEMSHYISKCLPYMKNYTDETTQETHTNNVFNCKETAGARKKDIFVDYLIDVEKVNIDRPIEKMVDRCPNCETNNLFHFPHSADLV